MRADGTSTCIQCVLSCGENVDSASVQETERHLNLHRQMDHWIDPNVVELIKRLKRELQLREDRRRRDDSA